MLDIKTKPPGILLKTAPSCAAASSVKHRNKIKQNKNRMNCSLV
jgi:hypothetical protein